MVHAGTSELRRGFTAHRKAAPQPDSSRYLLLFYGIECGLKLVWMRRRKLLNTEHVDPVLLSRGHDLMMWAKELRISPRRGVSSTFRLKRGGPALPVSNAHQAWRYGIDVEEADEKNLVTWIEELGDWVQEETAL